MTDSPAPRSVDATALRDWCANMVKAREYPKQCENANELNCWVRSTAHFAQQVLTLLDAQLPTTPAVLAKPEAQAGGPMRTGEYALLANRLKTARDDAETRRLLWDNQHVIGPALFVAHQATLIRGAGEAVKTEARTVHQMMSEPVADVGRIKEAGDREAAFKRMFRTKGTVEVCRRCDGVVENTDTGKCLFTDCPIRTHKEG